MTYSYASGGYVTYVLSIVPNKCSKYSYNNKLHSRRRLNNNVLCASVPLCLAMSHRAAGGLYKKSS
jgi:hypothetical protein